MKKKVRIGFVGVGGMGQCAHLKNYATLGDCEVVALAELRENTGKAVAARYGIKNVYLNHAEMLKSEDLDGIVASQPFDRHGILLSDLVRADLPIFIEKPLASSVEVGEAILEKLAQSKSRVMVGYNKRSELATVRAMQEISSLKESGEIGAMTYIRIIMPPGDWISGGYNDLIKREDPCPALERDPASPAYSEEQQKDFITFVNYYIHQVNLMRHLLGEDYAVTHADPSGVLLVGRSEGGIPCVIEMAPYSTTVDWQESALVAFQRGYIRLDLRAPLAANRPGRVEIYKDPGEGVVPETIIPELPLIHSMRAQAMNFVRFIRGEIDAPCDAEEALKDLKVAQEYLHLWKG